LPIAVTDLNVAQDPLVTGTDVKISWTDAQAPTNAIDSYKVEFLAFNSSYVSINGVCTDTFGTCTGSPTRTCGCTVPMATLTSFLGWTSGASAVIIKAQVTAYNSDGSATAIVADANSTNYLFVPTTAPTIALNARTSTSITMQFTCLSD
jgi:hypothetical protein